MFYFFFQVVQYTDPRSGTMASGDMQHIYLKFSDGFNNVTYSILSAVFLSLPTHIPFDFVSLRVNPENS